MILWCLPKNLAICNEFNELEIAILQFRTSVIKIKSKFNLKSKYYERKQGEFNRTSARQNLWCGNREFWGALALLNRPQASGQLIWEVLEKTYAEFSSIGSMFLIIS